jgi:hypothetical protein
VLLDRQTHQHTKLVLSTEYFSLSLALSRSHKHSLHHVEVVSFSLSDRDALVQYDDSVQQHTPSIVEYPPRDLVIDTEDTGAFWFGTRCGCDPIVVVVVVLAIHLDHIIHSPCHVVLRDSELGSRVLHATLLSRSHLHSDTNKHDSDNQQTNKQQTREGRKGSE